jgi:hypothetical protein
MARDLVRILEDHEREIKRLKQALARIEKTDDSIDWDTHEDGGNTAMATSFQAVASFSYTPPVDWGTYKLMAWGETTGSGFTGGDNFETHVQIDGVNGTSTPDNAGGTSRTVSAHSTASGLSGAVTVAFRARNSTAARGTTTTTWLRVMAVRTS